ncbi:MAG: effector-binding domain-containing protein [Paraglaciecola sp.]|jgi:effector-binding domain-containing protein
MSIKCEFTELRSQPCLSIRLRTGAAELPDAFARGYADIALYIKECKVEAAGCPFAIYYNLDMRNLDVEFGFPVPVKLDGRDNIQASQTPQGKSITALHIGPYSDVEPWYRALTEWIKDNGYEAAGIAYEVYQNDPIAAPPEKLKTQIYQMIRHIEL